MDAHRHHSTHVKRVVLPSGKTIEVFLFGPTHEPAPPEPPVPPESASLESDPELPFETPLDAEPDQDLHVCLGCGSSLVHPVEWEEAGADKWTVLLRCPDCDVYREGVFSQATVEAFDEELDRGADALATTYKRLMRANLADEIDRFAAALDAGAILPEDF